MGLQLHNHDITKVLWTRITFPQGSYTSNEQPVKRSAMEVAIDPVTNFTKNLPSEPTMRLCWGIYCRAKDLYSLRKVTLMSLRQSKMTKMILPYSHSICYKKMYFSHYTSSMDPQCYFLKASWNVGVFVKTYELCVKFRFNHMDYSHNLL